MGLADEPTSEAGVHPGKLSYSRWCHVQPAQQSLRLHSGGRAEDMGQERPDVQAEGQPASPSCRGPVGAVCDFRRGGPAVAVLGCSDGEAGRRKVLLPAVTGIASFFRVYAPERPSVEFLFPSWLPRCPCFHL